MAPTHLKLVLTAKPGQKKTGKLSSRTASHVSGSHTSESELTPPPPELGDDMETSDCEVERTFAGPVTDDGAGAGAGADDSDNNDDSDWPKHSCADEETDDDDPDKDGDYKDKDSEDKNNKDKDNKDSNNEEVNELDDTGDNKGNEWHNNAENN